MGEFWHLFANNHDAIRTATFLVGGLLGIGIAIWRARSSDKQAAASRSQAETAAKSVLNEQFKSGVELLGHQNVSVRLGGIFTLVELADLYPETIRHRLVPLFQGHLTYPPVFGSDKLGHNRGDVDYMSPDTVEIISIVNSRRLNSSTDDISLPESSPFQFENGQVQANPKHEDFRKWGSVSV